MLKKGFALLLLSQVLSPMGYANDDVLDANAPASLTCRNKPSKLAPFPEWVPGLKKFEGLKDISVQISLKKVTISHADFRKELTGEAQGALPTETYTVSGLGPEGKLVLGSAGPLLGAKSVLLSLSAEGKKPGEKESQVRRLELTCKNDNPGKRVAFIKLCTEAPEFGETSCKFRGDGEDEAFGMPTKFDFVSGDKGAIDVSYVDGNDDSAEESFAFIPNLEPPMNSTVKLIEYCYFAVKGKTESTFNSLRVSRPLAEKGKGFASISERASDGGASIPYDCAQKK